MSSTDNSELRQVLAEALSSRPYSHRQDVDSSIAAVVVVESDLRFLPSTLHAVLTQDVLPGVIVIADCTGLTSQPSSMGFDVTPSPSGPMERMPVTTTVSVQLVRAKGARSFGDAVSRALDYARLAPGTRGLWLLHDDSRPADSDCLERLLEAWRNTPTASLLGAKQLDWEGRFLHDVGRYAFRHRAVGLVVDGEPDQEQYDARSDVFSVSLAGALVPMDTWRTVGVNPWFSSYGESRDFGRRVCQCGGRVVVVPQARVAHRRARFEGVRTRTGEPLVERHPIDTTMSRLSAAQRYLYTDVAMWRWAPLWVWRLLRSLVMAVVCLFGKRPYVAWCELTMPWRALLGMPMALRARRLVARQTKVPLSGLSQLQVSRQQFDQYRDRRRAFADQRGVVLLSPLAKAHLRMRRTRRWTAALAMALASFAVVVAMFWDVFVAAFSGGSLHSDRLLATGADFGQLVSAATTPWSFGQGTGLPAAPAPWLMVLMLASLVTGGHVAAATTLMFFAAAPASAMAFWALAGVFTRSDAVRVAGGLLWASLGLALGLYADANLPMLAVMVFLPAAFAFVFRAVGMYHTEDPAVPHASVQCAALAALCFVPPVAAEPQLLLPLLASFLVFLLFSRHRVMLLLVPVPAAFVIAPTLVNVVRHGGDGLWRQLFGDATVSSVSSNGSPSALSLADLSVRAFGLDASDAVSPQVLRGLGWASLAVLAVLAALALVSLVLPFALRVSRMMWVVSLTGAMTAVVSTRVAVDIAVDGPVAGSALPGLAMTVMGLLSCVCLVAGGAVKRFVALRSSGDEVVATSMGSKARTGVVRVGRVCLVAVLVAGTALWGVNGMVRADVSRPGVSDGGLPMVAVDYLSQDPDNRVLALFAEDMNSVRYAVMRTARGDLIDASAAVRSQIISGHPGAADSTLASAAARLLSNADSQAIASISDLGFGGIYVVGAREENGRDAADRLTANVTASDGTQSVVSNDDGTYYRLTASGQGAGVDDKGQRHWQASGWRRAWLALAGVIIALYCLVAAPRPRRGWEEA